MHHIPRSFPVACALLAAFVNSTMGQDARRDNANKQSYTIHVRKLTEPERIVRIPIKGMSTVLDAVDALKLQTASLLQMDVWIVRRQADGRTQILPIDILRIIKQGRTETNFAIHARDRLFLQQRLRK